MDKMCDRVVVLVDMDCFYCQVETRLNPALQGKPLAVVQYNQWQGGGIIAVNYEARAFGVTRHLRGNEAKKKCPDIVLVSVPSMREKADISKYRDAGREVAAVFCQFTNCVERASIDEAYLDITKAVEERMHLIRKKKITPKQLPNTFVVGFSDLNSNDEDHRLGGLSTWLSNFHEEELEDPAEEKLAVGGIIVEEMRAAVFAQTGFRCSAGIAHNKVLAKLACGLHKPNRQTILPHSSVPVLYQSLPIKKIRSLGGKFGDYVTKVLGCSVMGDVAKFSLSQLQEHFDEKQGTWLYNIARGIDLEPVTPRLVSKSIGCCKNFPGKQALTTRTDVKQWLAALSAEVMERLIKDYDQNRRRAKMITVSYRQKSNSNSISSRCGPLSLYDVDHMAKEAYELLKSSNSSSAADDDKWEPALTFLGISAGKFSSEDRSQNKTINYFFKSGEKKQHVEPEGKDVSTENSEKNKLIISETNTSISNSSGIGSSLKCRLKDTDHCTRDGESFFRAYFKRKRESKLNVEHESVHAIGTDSGKHVESAVSLPSDDIQRNQKFSSEEEDNTKVEFSPTACTSYSHNNFQESEHWISPHEIFPNLDEADEETVALLPSPMQRKIRKSVEMKLKISNNYTKTTSISHCQNISSITSALCSSEKNVSHEPPCTSKTGESSNHFISGDIITSQQKHYSENGTNNCALADTQTSCKSSAYLNQRQEVANSVATSPVKTNSDSSIKIMDEQHEIEISGNIASEICPVCKSVILLSEYPEHLDFHMAEKLHKELNSTATLAVASGLHQVNKTKVNVTKRKKTGSVRNNQDSKTENKRVKCITSFFTPLR